MNGRLRSGARVLAPLVGAAALLWPSDAAAQQASASSVAEGARVYGNMCGRCHNARSPLERTDREWVTIVNHMRVRANLTGKQVRDVVAFLQATNADPRQEVALPGQPGVPVGARAPGRGPASDNPEVIARGRTLVQQSACLGCHVVGTEGSQVGPSLNGIVLRRGPDFVRQKLAEPTFNNATSMMPNFGLTEEQIEAIVAYLNTLRTR